MRKKVFSQVLREFYRYDFLRVNFTLIGEKRQKTALTRWKRTK